MRPRGYVPTEEPFRTRGAHRKSHQCAIKSARVTARVTARRRIVSALRRFPIIPRFRKDYTDANAHVSRNARANELASRGKRAFPKCSFLSLSLLYFYFETSLFVSFGREKANYSPNFALRKIDVSEAGRIKWAE